MRRVRCLVVTKEKPHLSLLTNTSYGTWPELPTVFMKLQGSQVIREEYGRMIEEIVQKHGGINYRHVHSQEDCDNLWKMRKNALPIVLTLTTPGIKGWTTDIW